MTFGLYLPNIPSSCVTARSLNNKHNVFLTHGEFASPVHRLLEVEISGWRDELRLRVLDARRNRLPHIEVVHASSTPGEDGHRLADDRWHTVSIGLSSMPTGAGRGGFYVRVDVDCRQVAGRRVHDLRLPWTQTSNFDDLSYLWIGQRTATESMLKASRNFLPVKVKR